MSPILLPGRQPEFQPTVPSPDSDPNPVEVTMVADRSAGQERTTAPRDGGLAGQTIQGRYRVIRQIGQGGMGTVYLAEQMSVSRKVALKVLRQKWSTDDELMRRFRQEARLAASLSHRSITTVFDFGQSEDGSFFMIMEYLDGAVLSDVIRQTGALDVRRALRLAIQIAEGLDAAHRTGIIHRDVKPQNLMVGSGDEIKLMDFGIARLRDRDDSAVSRPSVVFGTPAYMAPEQIDGEEVDERADIYALGVVLYEMLTGKTPFDGKTPIEILTQKRQNASMSVRQFREEVPRPIEAVVMRALQRDIDARPKHMSEMIQLLRSAELRDSERDPVSTSPAFATATASASAVEPGDLDPSRRSVEGKIRHANVARGNWHFLGVGALAGLLIASTASHFFTSGSEHVRLSPPEFERSSITRQTPYWRHEARGARHLAEAKKAHFERRDP